MSRRMLRASPLSIVLAVVIASATVAGFFFTNHSAEQQERTLLQSNTNQAALYAGSVFNQVGGLLDSVATGVALSDGAPQGFARQAAPFAQGGAALVLAQHTGAGYTVLAAAGSGFHTGEALAPALSATLASAGTRLTPTRAVFDGRSSTVGFAVGPPLVPAGLAVYMQVKLNPFLPSQATTAKSFKLLDAALYGSPTPARGALLVATTHDLPDPATAARAQVTVGSATWTLVAAAHSPLVGGFAHIAPTIVLALGLALALLVGLTVEVLDRRQRYAAAVVAERTAELERSLAELREAQTALLRGERLTALGEMATVVGHELRNPLSAVTNALYLLRHSVGEPTPRDLERHLVMAERETAKAASLAEDLVAFVRPREPQMESVQLRDVVHEVVEATPPPERVRLDVEVDPLVLRADRRQLAEVLTNLVSNAYQAVGDEGLVRITAAMNGAGAVVSVEDSGAGVDEAVAERIFEPFFTTKHDGTGLGLAIVRRLVEAHSGEVSLENRPDGAGARVVVRLPAEQAVAVR